jgi:hypothetical protein
MFLLTPTLILGHRGFLAYCFFSLLHQIYHRYNQMAKRGKNKADMGLDPVSSYLSSR